MHHPLSLVRSAQSLGYHVLLDAAAFVPAHPLSLRAHPADFVGLRRDRVVAQSKIRRADEKDYRGGYEAEGYAEPVTT